jgi:hypothetical protein
MNNNRHSPMFPSTTTTPDKQETVGGFTKFEQGVFLIAQGLCESGLYKIQEIGGFAVQITENIFDRMENINQ